MIRARIIHVRFFMIKRFEMNDYLTRVNNRFHRMFFGNVSDLSSDNHISEPFPTTWFSGTNPQNLLSNELWRLSPINQ